MKFFTSGTPHGRPTPTPSKTPSHEKLANGPVNRPDRARSGHVAQNLPNAQHCTCVLQIEDRGEAAKKIRELMFGKYTKEQLEAAAFASA